MFFLISAVNISLIIHISLDYLIMVPPCICLPLAVYYYIKPNVESTIQPDDGYVTITYKMVSDEFGVQILEKLSIPKIIQNEFCITADCLMCCLTCMATFELGNEYKYMITSIVVILFWFRVVIACCYILKKCIRCDETPQLV